MTTAPALDKNKWYHLYVNGNSKQALIGTSLFSTGGTKGSVFFNTTNTAANVQRWQIFPVTVNNTQYYTFRSKDGGPNAFMGTSYSEAEETEGKTRPIMMRGDIADNNVYWSFGTWGDSTWYLSNAANGTGYHLNRKGSGIMAMSPDIEAPQNGQRWSFDPIDKIDDEKYSSVSLVGVATSVSSSAVSSRTASPSTASTAPSSSPTITASSGTNQENRSGLSTGAKAAIGAAVGGVLLIALILLGLYLHKKRKQRIQYTQPYDTAYDSSRHDGSSTIKQESLLDGQAKYEMPDAHIVEVPNRHPPAELPAWAHQGQRRHPE